MKKQVVILGAGVTGLAAAWKLLNASSDFEITLLEKDPVPGGLAKTIAWHGYALDLGPHRIYTDLPRMKEFFQTFCREELIRVKRHSRMYINGRYITYPIRFLETFSALGGLTSLQFGFSAMRVLLESQGKHIQSYEEYMKGYYGKALYQRIFEPFAKKVWGIDPTQLAAETARVRLRGNTIWHALLDGLFSKQETYIAEFLYPQNGIGEVAQKFTAEIEEKGGSIHYRQDVSQVKGNEKGIHTVIAKQNGEEVSHPCDVLLNTIPLPQFVKKISPLASQSVKQSADFLHFRAIVLVYLLYPQSIAIEDTWLYFPEEHVPFTRVSVPDNFNPNKKNENRTCFCVEFTCEVGDETWRAETETLAEQAHAVFHESGLIDEPYADSLAVRIEPGYPVYEVGYEEKLEEVLQHLASFGNVITAGRQGLFRHNNIDQSIQMGLLAAEQIMQHPKNFTQWYNLTPQFKDYRIID